jgi:hypothetical protein
VVLQSGADGLTKWSYSSTTPIKSCQFNSAFDSVAVQLSTPFDQDYSDDQTKPQIVILNAADGGIMLSQQSALNEITLPEMTQFKQMRSWYDTRNGHHMVLQLGS